MQGPSAQCGQSHLARATPHAYLPTSFCDYPPLLYARVILREDFTPLYRFCVLRFKAQIVTQRFEVGSQGPTGAKKQGQPASARQHDPQKAVEEGSDTSIPAIPTQG